MSNRLSHGGPYKLLGKRLAFTNWSFVEPMGGNDWCEPSGNHTSIMSHCAKDDPAIVWNPKWVNRGVRLFANAAVKSGPLFAKDKPWDQRGLIATIIKDGDKYRAWGTTGWHYNRSEEHFLCYLESVDGMHFEKPDLGLFSYHGSMKNNIISDQIWQLHPGGIFIDPSALPHERYKWINEENFTYEDVQKFSVKHPDRVSASAVLYDHAMDDGSKKDIYVGARGAVSADGINWTFLEEPMLITFADTHPTCYYDQNLKRYVAYFRDYPFIPQAVSPGRSLQMSGWRRSVGRSQSVDFKSFPLPEICLTAPLTMNPNEVLYTNCHTTIPQAPDHHMMFPSIWDTGADVTYIVGASSVDGVDWQYLPGGKMLDTGNYGSWDGGYVFAYPDLLELPNGDFALPYAGFDVPHKYPRGLCQRNTGYAVWPKGRLCGIEAEEDGEFATILLVAQSLQISVNALTRRAGFIRIQVCRADGSVVQGRSFADCTPLCGDCFNVAVDWKGEHDIGIAQGEVFQLRFQMQRAQLFYIDFIEGARA